MGWKELIPESIRQKYEFYNYNHAGEILVQAFDSEFKEILQTLEKLRISVADLRTDGGNESPIPKKFDEVLYPYGWREIRIAGDLVINIYPRRAEQRGKFSDEASDQKIIKGYIDGHNIDFLKGNVAFDLEWNSKDQTFDRDILAMRTYYDCGIISVGIIITRAEDLNDVFKTIYSFNPKSKKYEPIMKKYGASTTWIGKLLPRLDSRRNGGCPILAIGIKKDVITDWSEDFLDPNKPND